MHITLARPSVSGCCAHHPVSPIAKSPTDAFISNFSVEALNDNRSLAALALEVKRNSAQGKLPADLGAVVTTQLGEAGIVNIKDERVRQLYGFFVEGLEIPSFDPLAVLGEGWEPQHGTHPSEDGPVSFSRFGDNVIQHLSFDVDSGSTVLNTVHQETFIATRHYSISEERNGKIVVKDETTA